MNLNRPQANDRHDVLVATLKGTVFSTFHYGDVEVLEYIDNNNVLVKFLNTGNIRRVNSANLRHGCIKDVASERRAKLIYGVGYPGLGRYSKSSNPKIYNIWVAMLGRCYNAKFLQKEPAFIGCSVCNEWHNFQNFAQWYVDNSKRDDYQLDKDVLHKNCKTYSPDTCLLLPEEINKMFVMRKNCRGEYPIGVTACTNSTGLFVAKLGNKYGFKRYLGCFHSTDKAFEAYKFAKEQLIKYVANLHKEEISEKAYNALLNYKVEITD